MEMLIKLTGAELDVVAGGSRTASVSVTDTAFGITALVRHLNHRHHGIVGQPVRDVFVVSLSTHTGIIFARGRLPRYPSPDCLDPAAHHDCSRRTESGVEK